MDAINSYLIEIPHDSDPLECMTAAKVLLKSNSHFIKHARWGCDDGVHKAWLIVDVEHKGQALQVVPQRYRAKAKVVRLSNYSLNEIEARIGKYESSHI